jgi:hypothetical protein
MILNTDFELDCLIAKILGTQPSNPEQEPFLGTIGYSIPDINERRLMAIKIAQKYFADFKISEAKPVNKMYLLSKGVNPYLIDKFLPFLNKYMVEYGVTTKVRAENFISLILEKTLLLTTPYKIQRNIEKDVEAFCKEWKYFRGNYLSDTGEVKTLKEAF